jgi:hypothetical protein
MLLTVCNNTLCNLIDRSVLVYLDNILIYSRDQTEHDRLVRLVLDRLRKHQSYATTGKCEFNKHEVKFLGYVVSVGGLKMGPGKVKAIPKWPTPTNLWEV